MIHWSRQNFREAESFLPNRLSLSIDVHTDPPPMVPIISFSFISRRTTGSGNAYTLAATSAHRVPIKLCTNSADAPGGLGIRSLTSRDLFASASRVLRATRHSLIPRARPPRFFEIRKPGAGPSKFVKFYIRVCASEQINVADVFFSFFECLHSLRCLGVRFSTMVNCGDNFYRCRKFVHLRFSHDWSRFFSNQQSQKIATRRKDLRYFLSFIASLFIDFWINIFNEILQM